MLVIVKPGMLKSMPWDVRAHATLILEVDLRRRPRSIKDRYAGTTGTVSWWWVIKRVIAWSKHT